MKGEVGAIVLAAGASSRMGFPKALLPTGRFSEETFLGAICMLLRATGIPSDRIAVVTGSSREEIEWEARRLSIDAVYNRRHALGQHSSARVGLRHAIAQGWQGALLWPCDAPFLHVSTVERILRAPWPAVPVHRGRPGHPLALDRASIERLLRQRATGSLREAILAAELSLVRVRVDDPAILHNVNTRRSYSQQVGLSFQAKSRSRRPVTSS